MNASYARGYATLSDLLAVGQLGRRVLVTRPQLVQGVPSAEVLTRARPPSQDQSVRIDTRAELALLRESLSAARREVNRAIWRRAVQRRTTVIARILRLAVRALRQAGGRRRFSHGWEVFVGGGDGTTPVLSVITRVPTASLADLAQRISVTVLVAELVDLRVLDTLGSDVTISSTETT